METAKKPPQSSKDGVQSAMSEKPKQASAAKEAKAAVMELPPSKMFEEVDDEDAAALMEAFSAKVTRQERFTVGQEVEGEVVKVGTEHLFLALGAKSEASMNKADFLTKGEEIPAIGQRVRAYVIAVKGETVELGRQLQAGSDASAVLEEALHSGLPVEGRVLSRNKGGLEIEVFHQRAFCPISQIELRFCENPDQYVGQTLMVRVVEVKENGRRIVVSRKALLEEEAARQREALREKLHEGAILEGVVTSLAKYGAFVDLGGLEGMIHVSEIAHHRVLAPEEALQKGQRVRVKVLSYAPENKRLALSMKALERDPWEEAAEVLKEGEDCEGTVERFEPYGAFVQLSRGVEGMVHVSELSHKRIGHPREVLEIGERRRFRVITFEPQRRRIALSLKALEDLPAPEAAPEAPPKPDLSAIREGMIFEVEVEKIEKFGLFVLLPDGQKGLIPNVEMGTPRNTDHGKMFPPGTRFSAAILQVDAANNRLRLSRKAVDEAEERQQTSEYRKKLASQQEEGGFGTLAAMLKKNLRS